MKVYVKFFIFDLPPGFEDAELELQDDAILNDVLDACLDVFKTRNVSMDENELRTATIIVNGKWSGLDAHVSDEDTVNIIRPMDGG